MMGLCLHDDGDEDGWAELLEQNVCERLKDGVRDEEDGECCIVGRRAEAQLGR